MMGISSDGACVGMAGYLLTKCICATDSAVLRITT
jgi:hypothetical protein